MSPGSLVDLYVDGYLSCVLIRHRLDSGRVGELVPVPPFAMNLCNCTDLELQVKCVKVQELNVKRSQLPSQFKPAVASSTNFNFSSDRGLITHLNGIACLRAMQQISKPLRVALTCNAETHK